MRDISLKRTLAYLILPCLLWPACSTANKNLTKQASVESQKPLAAGDFEKALSGFREATKKNPRGKELAANYVRTVEEIKQAADRALGQRDYARAETIYRVLLNNYADFGTFTTNLTFKKAYLETALKNCSAALVDGQARQALKAGDYGKALEIHQASLKENPGDAELAAKYRTTVNDIKAAGDMALGGKDFAQAGRVNVVLLKNFASFEGLRPPVAFNREALKDAVAACRESLTKTGLEEYRKGNLANAIAVWEGLLRFDPDNAEIKKAVNTAKTQLDGIKKKK
jgi:tetratricopeptide (TPR) repeat protein